MEKFSQIRRILIVILVLNWLVAFSKIIYGLITKCASMTADGVHSFADGASNVIGLVGIWVASKPSDQSHPYGHKKFETIATLGIAVVLFIAAFDIFRDAFLRIFTPVVPDVTIFSFAIILITMAINVFVMRYEHKKGHELTSDVLICDSMHTRSDIFASMSVLITLVSISLGFAYLDVIVASLIALLIAKSGFDILKMSSKVLCDGSVIAASDIEAIVGNIPGVKSIHNIRTRGREDDVHVDLHVRVDADTRVDDAHKLSHLIAGTLKGKLSGVTDVIVHIEPNR